MPREKADAWLWDLAPSEGRPVEVLSALARVLAGRRVDATGELEPALAWQRALDWETFLARARPPAAEEARVAWDLRKAQDAERAGLSELARFYLTRLVAARPRDADLYARSLRGLSLPAKRSAEELPAVKATAPPTKRTADDKARFDELMAWYKGDYKGDDKQAKIDETPKYYENVKGVTNKEWRDFYDDEIKKKKEAPRGTTLWERLGGEANVKKIVHYFLLRAAADPKVDFTRGGKFPVDDIAKLEKRLVEFVSMAAGGPLKYTGRSMKESHKGMMITDSQFDAAAAALKDALEKNGVRPEDVKAVLAAAGGTRKDIVEKKK